MARIVIKNLTASNIALPYPVSRSIKPGQELTIDGVDPDEYKTSEPLDILVESNKITVSIQEDPNIDNSLETEPLANTANEAVSLVGGGGGGGGVTKTETNLSFPIDYDNGTDPVAGTIFQSQTEIDDYLTANSITHFKHIQACWEAVPVHILHTVSLQCAAGVHRPRNPETLANAWNLSSYAGFPKVFHPGCSVRINGEAFNVGNWQELVSSQNVVSFSNASEDPQATVSGTPFTPGALKGYFVNFDSSPNLVYVIHDNTADTLYLCDNVPGSPTNLTVVAPATTLRNSYDDATIAKNASAVLFSVPQGDSASGIDGSTAYLFDLRLEQLSSRYGVEIHGGQSFTAYRCLFDQAGLKDVGWNWTGVAIYGRSASRINTYQSSFRGRMLASTPSTDSSKALDLVGCVSDWAYPGIVERSYLGGSGTQGVIGLSESTLRFSSGVIGDCQSDAVRCSRSTFEMVTGFNVKRTTIRNVVSGNGISLQTESKLVPTNSNTVGETAGTITGIGLAGSAAIFLDDNSYARLGQLDDGGTPNPGYAVRITGSLSKVIASVTTTISGTSGDIEYDTSTGKVPMSWADLTARKRCSTQPVGSLKGVVEVLGVEDGSANGQGILTFTLSGTTLQWRENGDVTSGAGVNVSGGGYFTLASGNGKKIRVYVDATLPGTNTTDNAIISHNPLQAQDAGSFISKPF